MFGDYCRLCARMFRRSLTKGKPKKNNFMKPSYDSLYTEPLERSSSTNVNLLGYKYKKISNEFQYCWYM